MHDDTPAVNRKSWLTSPWVLGLSLLLNVLQLVAGVFFYVASQKYRELAFYVHPNRASIVTPHGASDIHVLYNGHEIEGGGDGCSDFDLESRE